MLHSDQVDEFVTESRSPGPSPLLLTLSRLSPLLVLSHCPREVVSVWPGRLDPSSTGSTKELAGRNGPEDMPLMQLSYNTDRYKNNASDRDCARV